MSALSSPGLARPILAVSLIAWSLSLASTPAAMQTPSFVSVARSIIERVDNAIDTFDVVSATTVVDTEPFVDTWFREVSVVTA